MTGDVKMPFKSKAQQRMMYALSAKGKISKDVVDEMSSETNYKGLPEKITKKAELNKAFGGVTSSLFKPVENPPVKMQDINKGEIDTAKDERLQGMSPAEYRKENVAKKNGILRRASAPSQAV